MVSHNGVSVATPGAMASEYVVLEHTRRKDSTCRRCRRRHHHRLEGLSGPSLIYPAGPQCLQRLQLDGVYCRAGEDISRIIEDVDDFETWYIDEKMNTPRFLQRISEKKEIL